MRHRSSRSPEPYVGSPVPSATTTVDLHTGDVRRIPTEALIAELADLEERLRPVDPDDDAGGARPPTRQDLVDAEYRILRELRRRQTLDGPRIRWNPFRPRRVRAD